MTKRTSAESPEGASVNPEAQRRATEAQASVGNPAIIGKKIAARAYERPVTLALRVRLTGIYSLKSTC